ncbi:hypothetical protein H9P43_005610 [Blastocladiella emersonii ATCC 22665]|nr:hypothetical protein H9P43_005610 [Blastocladiella emersonii ATCC 22665]
MRREKICSTRWEKVWVTRDGAPFPVLKWVKSDVPLPEVDDTDDLEVPSESVDPSSSAVEPEPESKPAEEPVAMEVDGEGVADGEVDADGAKDTDSTFMAAHDTAMYDQEHELDVDAPAAPTE